MDIDAAIIEVEFQIESTYDFFGHFVALRFVDIIPSKPKLMNTIQELTRNQEVELINYNYTITPITEKTNLKYLDITRH